jgi:hypothetical protein
MRPVVDLQEVTEEEEVEEEGVSDGGESMLMKMSAGRI